VLLRGYITRGQNADFGGPVPEIIEISRPSVFLHARAGGVEQVFRPAVRSGAWTALAAEVHLVTIPHRGTTSESTYFVTANVEPRRDLFQVDKIARLFIEVLFGYREQKKYLLHEFIVMPDHFHLILTPTGITLERAMQLVKGGFSFQLNKNLKLSGMSGSPVSLIVV
jgi:hypothetical protein